MAIDCGLFRGARRRRCGCCFSPRRQSGGCDLVLVEGSRFNLDLILTDQSAECDHVGDAFDLKQAGTTTQSWISRRLIASWPLPSRV